MAEPEWGTKRQCPKCGTRFYDLGKDDPITCISCGAQFAPEVALKSKQQPQQIAKPDAKVEEAEDEDVLDDDIEVDVDVDVDDSGLLDEDDDDTDVSDVVAPVVKPDND